MPELPPLLFAPLDARSAAYFTDPPELNALERLIESTENEDTDKERDLLRELKAKTRVIASDEPDWWHASVSHSRPEKSVSLKVGFWVFLFITIECVILIPISSVSKDCDVRCILPAATLGTPFAFFTLPIGVLDTLITIKEAMAVLARSKQQKANWEWELFVWHLFEPFPKCCNMEDPYNQENKLYNQNDNKIADIVITQASQTSSEQTRTPKTEMKTGMKTEMTQEMKREIKRELREALRIEEAWSIFWRTLLGHIFLLALCILLYTPGCTSWRIQILTTATLLSISVGLMWADRWRYKITPLQMLFLIALLLPSGILLTQEFEHVEWLPFAPLWELCNATSAVNASDIGPS